MTNPLELPRVECDCATCQSYCKHAPGWFLPHEIDKAAALLGLTPEEFFARHLTVDCWVGENRVFTLRPRTTKEAGGEMSPYDPRGVCSFFKDNRCAIHAAKPHECACTAHDVNPDGFHAATADAWRPHQERVTALLGEEPEEPRDDGSLGLSMFSMFDQHWSEEDDDG